VNRIAGDPTGLGNNMVEIALARKCRLTLKAIERGYACISRPREHVL
jgi:hypothetical protein